jgi:hypothetical protein
LTKKQELWTIAQVNFSMFKNPKYDMSLEPKTLATVGGNEDEIPAIMISGSKRQHDDIEGTLRKRTRHSESDISDEEHEMVTIDQSAEELQVEATIEPGFKTGPWVYDEDERLIQSVGIFKKPDGNINWAEVTRFIGDRSQKQCYVRWNTLLKYRGMGTRRGAWTAEEDARLTEAVSRHERKGGGVYWAKVSEEMGGDRTYQQCLKRWKQVLQHVGSGARTCAWTDEEDARLVEAMTLYDGQGKGGGVDWNKVSDYLGGARAGSQCYKRWHDALKQRRKSLLGEDWTTQEDFLVIQAVAQYAGEGLGGGVDWEAVSAHMGGLKTSKQCNRRWNRVLKIKEGIEGRVRTDPWDVMEERILLSGISACRANPGGPNGEVVSSVLTPVAPPPHENGGISAQPTEPFANMNPTKDLQPPLDGDQTNYEHTGEHKENYPEDAYQSNMPPPEHEIFDDTIFETDPRSVDWQRVSTEFLGNNRNAKQCEKRFEGMQRQRLRESSGFRDSIGDGYDPMQEEERRASTGNMYDDGEADGQEISADGSSTRRLSMADRPRTTLLNASYYRHRGRAIKTGPWLPDEDERLIEAVALYEGQGRGGAVDWGRVCEFMGGYRTYDQCRIRWNGVLKVLRIKGTVVKTGPWAKSEVRESRAKLIIFFILSNYLTLNKIFYPSLILGLVLVLVLYIVCRTIVL